MNNYTIVLDARKQNGLAVNQYDLSKEIMLYPLIIVKQISTSLQLNKALNFNLSRLVNQIRYYNDRRDLSSYLGGNY